MKHLCGSCAGLKNRVREEAMHDLPDCLPVLKGHGWCLEGLPTVKFSMSSLPR